MRNPTISKISTPHGDMSVNPLLSDYATLAFNEPTYVSVFVTRDHLEHYKPVTLKYIMLLLRGERLMEVELGSNVLAEKILTTENMVRVIDSLRPKAEWAVL